jgi:hypothetical protein
MTNEERKDLSRRPTADWQREVDVDDLIKLSKQQNREIADPYIFRITHPIYGPLNKHKAEVELSEKIKSR